MNERRIRNQKGAAVTGLVLALFMFIMLIGFFAFDSSRLQMAQRELTATCDSASLAGTAMLTSAPIDNDDATATKLRDAQTKACAYARNMFQAGNMLGKSLSGATVVSPLSAVGVVGAPASCNVMVALADPLNQYVGVAPTFPDCLNGRAVMCYAGYTYSPVFLGIVGIQKVGLNANSGGGLPQVDAVLVFDNSGSMDDATNVTFVRRTWDSTIAKTGGAAIMNWSNNIVAPLAGPPLNSGQAQNATHGVVHYIEVPPPSATTHRLSDYLNHNYTNNPNGLALNVLPPMSLATADNTDSQVGNRYVLDKNLRVNTIPYAGIGVHGGITNGAVPTKWQKDYGTPPGNCTLAQGNGNAYGGYGSYWNESAPGMRVNDPSINGNAAYDTARITFRPSEHPTSIAGPIQYTAQNNSGTDAHVFTDLVVNIANPGSWPYTQPLNGPQTFVDTGNITFPSQEPDTLLAGQSFRFENLGVLVEAARGNLDSAANFNDALLDRGSFYTTIYPSASRINTALTSGHCGVNYQRAYQRLAMLYSQPIATAIDGANGGFFQKINSLTDCRFGFVGFSNAAQAMSSPSGPNFTTNGSAHGTASDSNNSFYIDASFGGGRNIRHMFTSQVTAGPENNTGIAGGSGTGFRQPRRVLAKSDTQPVSFGGVVGGMSSVTSNGAYNAPWSALSSSAQANGLENGRPLDQTDTAEALTTARAMFHNGANYDIATLSNNRPAGKHAIVLFTDGIPRGGIASTEASQTLTVAQACKGDGIAIFTIGLDVTGNPVLQAQQPVFLGNASTGLAGAAGNGGKFFPCASANTVKDAFSAVARRLTQGQR